MKWITRFDDYYSRNNTNWKYKTILWKDRGRKKGYEAVIKEVEFVCDELDIDDAGQWVEREIQRTQHKTRLAAELVLWKFTNHLNADHMFTTYRRHD